MCKKYQVNQFPTVILFDQKAKPVRTVIGFSWFEIATLYATQERIISGKGIKHLNIVYLLLFRIAWPATNKCKLKWVRQNNNNKKNLRMKMIMIDNQLRKMKEKEILTSLLLMS